MTSNNEIVMDINENFLTETNVKILLRENERIGEPVYIEAIPKKLGSGFLL